MTGIGGEEADDEWAAIEASFDARVEASALLMLCRKAHEAAMREMRMSELYLDRAINRARRARRRAEHAGALLTDAVKLVELRRSL